MLRDARGSPYRHVGHLASQLGLGVPSAWAAEAGRTKSLYRYQAAGREHICVTPFSEAAERLLTDIMLKAAETMSDPYGGIAYHHIADSYIALFTSFITCGVWEAVHILDALLKNRSAIQPDTLQADTQGQSEPVFGLCRLLGIKLMPRMRGLSDATFYRPARLIRFQHIDALFGGEIDWDLIPRTRGT
jgi:hypothetical protein